MPYKDPRRRADCRRRWAEKNPEKVRNAHKKFNDANVEARRVYVRPNKKAYYQEYFKRRYSTDVKFRVAHLLRRRLAAALHGNHKAGSAVRDLGCTIPELKAHLEQRFQPGMSWDNHGAWHIDHVKPLASFDLTDAVQVQKACNYSNLQPLWAGDNLKKGAKC
jgi:hypothetical protein